MKRETLALEGGVDALCTSNRQTRRHISAAEQSKAGVTPDLIRLSIGIEHIDDIIGDLDQALAAAQAPRAVPSVALHAAE
jgi:cystathionine beta-lyase/cystathionine gamma-synthase